MVTLIYTTCAEESGFSSKYEIVGGFSIDIIAPELGLGLGGGGYNIYGFKQFENCIHNLL